MDFPPSSSERGGSTAFTSFHEGVQRWVWKEGWAGLRPVQEEAAPYILAGERDVMISAPTAGGKTEAAFLSIASRLAEADQSGIGCLAISPLKALINDQTRRLEPLFEAVGLPITPWHGDVSATRKSKFIASPRGGLLLITPESLEALFVRRGSAARKLFENLQYIVVDELHSFIGTERGRQLQSLMNRVELVARRKVPRIALSATLGEMDLAAEALRIGSGDEVVRIEDLDGQRELQLQLRGYEDGIPVVLPASGADESESETTHFDRVAEDLFELLRGEKNLIFANSRQRVESLADQLRRMCERERLPNEFFAHHGNLSKEIREDAEDRVRTDPRPTSIVCTSTLELGVDIGSVKSIAQVGSPPGVSSLLQRLGRSGRRDGDPRILRLFVTEDSVGTTSDVQDELRVQTFQSVAMIQLLLSKWCESPADRQLHLSTLVQQVLSTIAQHGGVSPADLYSVLCVSGPFRRVTTDMFSVLLRALGEQRILTQLGDGDLTLGDLGERVVEHYSFYAAFTTPEEYRLVSGARTLGTMPIDHPLMVGGYLIFAGRRWEIRSVDEAVRVADLSPAGGGRPPRFGGGGFDIAGRVREEMRRMYCSSLVPIYLDDEAKCFLSEGRSAFHRMSLDSTSVILHRSGASLYPWGSDRVHHTLALMLTSLGAKASVEGVVVRVESGDSARLRELLEKVKLGDVASGASLIDLASIPENGKHDNLLPDELLRMDVASRVLDEAGASQNASSLLEAF